MPLSIVASSSEHNQNLTDISKYDNGTTVFEGDYLIDKNKINKCPIVSNMGYLFKEIQNNEFADAFFSIATGSVSIPASELISGNVDKQGRAKGFEGPGYVVIEDNVINVVSPGEFVWGRNTPYTQAVIVDDGIDIINNKTNETISHINANDITNDTIPGDIVSEETIKYWYNHYNKGSKYNLEYCIDDMNDGRSYITPDVLKEKFPDAYDYSVKYPGGSPVIIYSADCTDEEVSSSYSYLGSFPQYNNANREYNAKQFVKAWNGTIIPANTSGCGRDGVSFSAIKEENAASGSATHGVCPPARALRNAVLSLGFDLPVGMDTGRDAVLFGFSPSTGIRITNTLNYPIKIIMWTDGSGTGMGIGAKIVEMIPDNAINNTNSSNTNN